MVHMSELHVREPAPLSSNPDSAGMADHAHKSRQARCGIVDNNSDGWIQEPA